MSIKKEEQTQKFFTNNYIKKWRINQLKGIKSMSKFIIWKEKLNMKKIDEPEFIVSSEELKRNQERSYEREYYLKQEKQDKIVTITIIVLAILMLILTGYALSKQYSKGLEMCISGGNSESFCRANL